MGGHLHADNVTRYGLSGARFTVTLPTVPARKQGERVMMRQTAHVLVAEDEALAALGMQLMLTRWGYG